MQSAVKCHASQVSVMVKRNLLHVIRNSESLVMTLFLPIMVTLVFVYVFGGAFDPGGDRKEYLKYVLPGIIVMTPAFGAYMTGVGVNNDMSKGIIDRFRTLDINQSSVIAGHIVSSLIRNLIGAIIVVAFSFLIGFRTDVSILSWFGVIGIATLYFLMITMLSLLVGLIGSDPESVGGMLMFVQFAPYVSSAFIPTETMPQGLKVFADHQPFTPIANTIRGLLLGMDVSGDWIAAIMWCTIIIIVCFYLSRYLFAHKTSG